jgi:hypothetical protein
MSIMKSRLMKRLGIGTAALLGLGAVALQSTPADARVFFSVGVPAYGYAPYYPYAYPAYSYGYYSPYYGYPYGGFTVGFGGGYHHHHHHWD